MDVISYRGPGTAGGVSSGLASAWRAQRNTSSAWWFLLDESLSKLKLDDDRPLFHTQFNENTVKGHYRFCNNFLWPIMHDLPIHSCFSADDLSHYQDFNRVFGQFVAFEQSQRTKFFVNDYQLALLPKYLGLCGGQISTFWHIPWPKSVPIEYVDVITSIARGLLWSQTIGFHTREYAENFMSFVNSNCSDLFVDYADLSISNTSISNTKLSSKNQSREQSKARPERSTGPNSFITRPLRYICRQRPASRSQIVVAPLGIDQEFWLSLSTAATSTTVSTLLDSVKDTKLVLSVDRADYTKAVLERLLIIDRFLSENFLWQGRVSFLQIAGRSRAGLPAFDQYWDKCHHLANAINERWRTNNWQPVKWVEEPLPAQDLSTLYRHADTMLVNPVRDGLNLTAKEFIACQHENPGVLLLSEGAGAWQELGKYALSANPLQVHATADSLVRALSMSSLERRWRNAHLKQLLKQNPLDKWLQKIALAGSAGTERIATSKEDTARSA